MRASKAVAYLEDFVRNARSEKEAYEWALRFGYSDKPGEYEGSDLREIAGEAWYNAQVARSSSSTEEEKEDTD